jgi:DNA-binding CsgD family transcriptional regulator
VPHDEITPDPTGTGNTEGDAMSVTQQQPAPPRRLALRPLDELDSQILEMLANGATSAQMSMRLHLSRQGIDYHITQLQRRFKVRSRPALVSRAYVLGVMVVDTWPPRIADEYVR